MLQLHTSNELLIVSHKHVISNLMCPKLNTWSSSSPSLKPVSPNNRPCFWSQKPWNIHSSVFMSPTPTPHTPYSICEEILLTLLSVCFQNLVTYHPSCLYLVTITSQPSLLQSLSSPQFFLDLQLMNLLITT